MITQGSLNSSYDYKLIQKWWLHLNHHLPSVSYPFSSTQNGQNEIEHSHPFLVMLLNNFRVLIFAVSSPYLMIQKPSLGQIPPSYILLTTFLPLKYKLSFWLGTAYCLKFIKNIYYTANDNLRISKAFKWIKLRFYRGQNSLWKEILIHVF